MARLVNRKWTKRVTSPENAFGACPKLFNFIFCIITGIPASTSDVMDIDGKGSPLVKSKGVDVWDWEPGIVYFKNFLYRQGNLKFKKGGRIDHYA